MMEVSSGKPPAAAPRALPRLLLEDVEVMNEVLNVGVFGELKEAVWMGTPLAARKLLEEKRDEQVKSCILWNSLNHPNIVMLMGAFASPDGTLWAVTELLTVNLANLLQSSPHSMVSLPFKLAILRDVACGVRYLHSLTPRPLLHGDLQAGHVFLTPSVRAKLDLGDTFFASNQKMRREIAQGMLNSDLEVIFHLSPEVIAEGCEAVKQSGKTGSDTFSFGVLCLHVLVHKVPIPKEAMIVVNNDDAIFFSEEERRSDYTSILKGKEKLFLPIIAQCLDPVAAHRPSMTDLCLRLSQLQPQLSEGKCGESVLNGGTMVDVSHHLQHISASADAAADELESFERTLRSLMGLADDEPVPVPNTPILSRTAEGEQYSYSPPFARLKSLPGHYRHGWRPPVVTSSERDIDEKGEHQATRVGSYDYVHLNFSPVLPHHPSKKLSFSPDLPRHLRQSLNDSPVFPHRQTAPINDRSRESSPSIHPNPAYGSIESIPPMHPNPAYGSIESSPPMHPNPAYGSIESSPPMSRNPAYASIESSPPMSRNPAYASIESCPPMRRNPAYETM